MKTIDYQTTGTCSRMIHVAADGDNIIREVSFEGGCNGNLKGIASLIIGQKIDDVIEKVSGITCGYKSTSCPDQLGIALRMLKEKE